MQLLSLERTAVHVNYVRGTQLLKLSKLIQ